MKYTCCSVLLLVFFSHSSQAAEIGSNIDNSLKHCKVSAVSTIDSQNCYDVALKEWDSELGKEYKLLMNGQPDNIRIALRDSQRQWIKYRDKYVSAIDVFYKQQGGTISSLTAAESKLNITREKAIDLYRLRSSTDLSTSLNHDIISQQESNMGGDNSKVEPVNISSEPIQKEEIILNPAFKTIVDDFFTKYLSFNKKDMDIDFDDFNNKIQYLYKASGEMVDYTSNKKAYTYSLSTGIKMIVLVNRNNNQVNYVGMIYDSHEGGSLKDFILSNIKISMILQKITDPTQTNAFLSQLANEGDGEGVLSGNKYRIYNNNGGYVFIVRKE